MLTLYHCNTSYASQIVRLYLAEMNIEWQSQHVNLRKQEQITSDYRNINPTGLVPCLVDNVQHKTIANSTDIMLYLDDNYVAPTQQLAEESRPEVVKFCRYLEGLHDPHLRTLSYCYLFIPKGSIEPEKKERLMSLAKQHPNKARGEFILKIANGDFSDEELSVAEQAIFLALAKLQSILEQSQAEFLFANKYTMADAGATAALFRIEKLDLLTEIEKHHLLSDYYGAMKRRDSFEVADMC